MTGTIATTIVFGFRAAGIYSAQPRSGEVAGRIVVPCYANGACSGGALNGVVLIKGFAADHAAGFIDVAVPIKANFVVKPYIVAFVDYLPISFGFAASAVYGRTQSAKIASTLRITAQARGASLVTATAAPVVQISATAVGRTESINSLYGRVIITGRLLVASPVNITVAAEVPIRVQARGATAPKYGNIAARLSIRARAQGKLNLSGKIAGTVVVLSRFTVPPANFSQRIGAIGGNIVVSSTITAQLSANETAIFGSVASAIQISTVFGATRGNVSPAGVISGTVVVQGTLLQSENSIQVAKFNANVVTAFPVKEGISIFKTGVNAVAIQRPSSVIVNKAVVYAVIAPGEPGSPPPGESADAYQAYLFF